MSRGRSAAIERPRGKASDKKQDDKGNQAKAENETQSGRETIESIVVAVILAFLFRAFIAEAFVIPTGSMAPTLQGRHLDVVCDECGYQYRTGASSENEFRSRDVVDETTCPICRYPKSLDRSTADASFLLKGNEDSFSGDRILVSKFAYQLGEPERWDVIVFKYPGNAKQNYIKRLVGLPGETVAIRHGDIFTTQQRLENGQLEGVRIARKPPHKVKAMLQLVDDTNYISKTLKKVGWPSKWGEESNVAEEYRWQISDEGSKYRVAAGDDISWLRFRHIVPTQDEWQYIEEFGELPETLTHRDGKLILDHYAYNDATPSREPTSWVGDLALEAKVDVESDSGELILKLVEGGQQYHCRIDVSTGEATLSINDGAESFIDEEGNQEAHPRASTKVRGPSRFNLRFANVDDRLYLWVNEWPVEFDGPTTFMSDPDQRPHWSPEEPGDLAPLGIGGRNIKLHVDRLRVLRDIYYLALQPDYPHSDYDSYTDSVGVIAADPSRWATTELFDSRREALFELGEDQFFPMGDNSPQSKDARLWSHGNADIGYGDPDPWVERKYLIGKAVLIYWPHAWRPFWPNFPSMGLIH